MNIRIIVKAQPVSRENVKFHVFLAKMPDFLKKQRNRSTVVVVWRSGERVGLDQHSYPTPGPVSTGMGDRVRGSIPGAGKPISV